MRPRAFIERDGTRLAWRAFGGEGPSALLLHGLAGHADEWEDTAAWLTERCRVVSFDQRGHGRSERVLSDVSRDAHIADAVFVIERMRLAPTLVIGQSLGGQLGLLIAARRPDLVRGLVVAEASPDGGDPDTMRHAIRSVGDLLRQWPVPFPDRAAAVRYFGGPSLAAEAWATGLEARAGGLFPSFDVKTLERTLGEAMECSYWHEWEQIRCPTLIVRAGRGTLTPATANVMSKRLPGAKLVEIPAARHDLHLDAPAEWRSALTGFLDEVDGRASPAT